MITFRRVPYFFVALVFFLGQSVVNVFASNLDAGSEGIELMVRGAPASPSEFDSEKIQEEFQKDISALKFGAGPLDAETVDLVVKELPLPPFELGVAADDPRAEVIEKPLASFRTSIFRGCAMGLLIYSSHNILMELQRHQAELSLLPEEESFLGSMVRRNLQEAKESSFHSYPVRFEENAQEWPCSSSYIACLEQDPFDSSCAKTLEECAAGMPLDKELLRAHEVLLQLDRKLDEAFEIEFDRAKDDLRDRVDQFVEERRSIFDKENFFSSRRLSSITNYFRNVTNSFKNFIDGVNELGFVPEEYQKIAEEDNYKEISDIEGAVCTLPICEGGLGPYIGGATFGISLAFNIVIFGTAFYCLLMPFSEFPCHVCIQFKKMFCGIITLTYFTALIVLMQRCCKDFIGGRWCFPSPPFGEGVPCDKLPCGCGKLCVCSVKDRFSKQIDKHLCCLRLCCPRKKTEGA